MIGSQQAQDVINSNDENDVLGRIRIVDSLLRHGWMIELYAHREARPEHVHWPNSRFHSLGIVEIANSYPLHKNLQLSLFPPTDPGFSRFMRVDKTHVDKPDAFKDHAIVTLKTFWRVDDMHPRMYGEKYQWHSSFKGHLSLCGRSVDPRVVKATNRHGLECCREMLLVLRSPALRRWRRLANVVRVRPIALYWQERTQMHLAAPGGKGRKSDLDAYREDGF